MHYSVSRAGNFEATWTMRGNHILRVVAFASPPVGVTVGAATGFRQYEFFIDLVSFSSLPKVYRLGLSNKVGRRPHNHYSPKEERLPSSNNIASFEAPHNPEEVRSSQHIYRNKI